MKSESPIVDLVEVDCPVCGSASKRHLFDVRDYAHPSFEERFGVCVCTACSCGFLSPRPSKKSLPAFYDPAFYWNYEGGKSDPNVVLTARKAQILAKKSLVGDLKPGRLLDIGAMKGEFVHVLRQDGWDAEGTDFSSNAENLFNVPMRIGDFLSLPYAESSFDCITMWAVLEHVYEPSEYIAKIARLLKPGGRFIALVTNFNSLQARVQRADDYPRHLTLFTRSSLARITRSHGLLPDRLFTDQAIFGHSLHGSLVYATKRVLGYGVDEVYYEWRNLSDPHAFCCKWRNQWSNALRWVSRVDRAISLPIEFLLDRIGAGFTLTCIAHKPN